jgi:hypothetical protein
MKKERLQFAEIEKMMKEQISSLRKSIEQK